jgi:serine/threonine-protein kinase HipA
MMKLKYCPSTLMEGYEMYSPKGLKALFDGASVSPFLDFEFEDMRRAGDATDSIHKISVSGVQEKFAAVIDGGKIRLAQSQERSMYILKPAPWDETLLARKQIPANEHVTMQIAAQVYGIQTAANGLCFTPSGQTVYITRRFDILPGGTKLRMEDFAAIVGRNEQLASAQFKYTGSYEEIAVAIRRHVAAWMVDMERFFELVVFNYIYGNGDAHLKNFSLMNDGHDLRLAPAYDLINTCLHVQGADLGLDGGLSPNIEPSDTFTRTGHLCRLDFERFGAQIGLSPARVHRILDKYMSLPDEVTALVSHSFLLEKMQRNYLRIVHERLARFVRKSEG